VYEPVAGKLAALIASDQLDVPEVARSTSVALAKLVPFQ
jgi:hypothetical protein